MSSPGKMEPSTFLIKPGTDNWGGHSFLVFTILYGLHTFLVCIARASTDRAVWHLRSSEIQGGIRKQSLTHGHFSPTCVFCIQWSNPNMGIKVQRGGSHMPTVTVLLVEAPPSNERSQRITYCPPEGKCVLIPFPEIHSQFVGCRIQCLSR